MTASWDQGLPRFPALLNQLLPEYGDRTLGLLQRACWHLDVMPVESVTGEVVARLCLTCDSQLQP